MKSSKRMSFRLSALSFQPKSDYIEFGEALSIAHARLLGPLIRTLNFGVTTHQI
jgi:hypothetical protein